MALKKSEKRLLLILGIAILVFAVDKFILGGKKKAKPVPVKTTTAQTAAVSANKTAAAKPAAPNPNRKVVQYNNWGRDPFEIPGAPPVAAAAAEIALSKKHKLRGLIWKEGKAFALIDDLILAEGQEKGGIRLDRVRENTVTCSKSGRTFTLKLEEK